MSELAAGVYARISLDDAGTGLGVARQEEDCTAKAKALKWPITDIYVDNDLSASTGKPRPQYERMLNDLESGRINAVVVYDLDRLTRRPVELEAFIDLCDRLSVSLANVAGDVDLTSSGGRLVARIKGAVSRQEAERIGERVKRQKRQRAEQGLPQGGRERLFGYSRTWEVLPDEAALVVEMFTRRAAGESITAISKDLTKRGLVTVAGKPWGGNNMGKLLRKPIYCGLREFNGEIIGPSAVPALVDEVLFNAAQANITRDAKGTNTRTHLLSGILICGECLSPMKGNSYAGMYRCSRTYGGCGKRSVKIDNADKWIRHAAMTRRHMTPKPGAAPARDFGTEIATQEAAIARLQAGYTAGVYELSEVQPLIRAERDALKALVKAQAKAMPKMKRATQVYFDFARMNLSQKRAFIGDYISNVVVGPQVSRGNQPFNPARFEAHYTDGTKEHLSSTD